MRGGNIKKKKCSILFQLIREVSEQQAAGNPAAIHDMPVNGVMIGMWCAMSATRIELLLSKD